MRWVDFARGTARLRITGAYPQDVLNRLAARNIPFWDILRRDGMCLELTVYRTHLPRCRSAAGRAMCDLEVLSLHGVRALLYGLRRRPALCVGLILTLAMALWSQRYVWTLEVQGNEAVPSEEILRTLSELGVSVGTVRSEIDPQRLENRMLDRIPELSWFTVNANSTRATVLVRERIPKPEIVDPHQPANVVASRPGLIETMEVYDGMALAEPGQTVVTGQLLVSGLTASFRATVLHHAMAEVYARTWRESEIITPKNVTEKVPTDREETVWRLLIGNKFMKICGNSGISAEPCDKMITTCSLKLPGGITLPIALEKTVCRYYTSAAAVREPEALRQRLLQRYTQWLRSDMVAGQIRSLDGTLSEEAAVWRLQVMCECTEQIGVLSPILLNTKEDERG